MSKEKTGVGKILAGIWHLISSIFHNSIKGAQKDFNNLTDAEKELLKTSVGITDFISKTVFKPGQVKEAFLEAFPGVDFIQFESVIFGIAHLFNIDTSDNDFEGIILKLQEHFNSLQGKIWDQALDAAANVASFLLAPKDSKFEAGFALIKYVYLTFFKKK